MKKADTGFTFLTIRNVPVEMKRLLEKERAARGVRTLNELVIQVLGQTLGYKDQGSKDNGLGALAGTWSEQEFTEFQKNTAEFESLDPELWR